VVFKKIEENYVNFVIHSGLGNGKTCFLKGVEALGIQKGFKVFQFQKYYDITNSEIEKICLLESKNLVLIESYSNYLDIIEKFNMFRKPNTILLLSERTIINDTIYYTLEEKIGENYYSINLNFIQGNEVLELSELLTSYGLWGKYSSLSKESKRKMIVNDFASSFRLVMLDVLKSPNIQQKFTGIIDSLQSNIAFYHAALLIISSNILGFNLDLEELVYILDDELLNNPSFYNNNKLKEIIDFSSKRIIMNSSILAEGILHSNKYNHDLIPILVKVVKKLDKTRYNKNHYNILVSIISHSRLQKLFNTREHNDYRRLVIQFFEEIKNTGYAKTSPFFWLQYAMARLEIRDYIVADQFFETAYSWARKKEDFDTFQIDNHYARHLIENEIYNGDLESCMPQFLKAHKILRNRSDKNRNRHYPIKVARNYSIFYDHYFRLLNEQDKQIFLKSCQEILYRIDEYNSVVEERYRNRVVKECFNDLSSILLRENYTKK
jgi:hypothetical protein